MVRPVKDEVFDGQRLFELNDVKINYVKHKLNDATIVTDGMTELETQEDTRPLWDKATREDMEGEKS